MGQSALSRAEMPVPVAEAIGIGKRLGATIALQNVGIRVLAGESHALVGRNGAGKSTLVGVLTGMRMRDAGSVAFNGAPAPPLDDRAAWQRCVACVYQHSTIIPALSVAENLFVNRQPARGGVIDWRGMRQQARALLDRWQVDVSETALARDLGVEQRQLVEIARALSYGARFIILDEPTAQLDGAAIGRLFARMRELQRAGVTFLFISHHLQEVYEICQAVTVLRDGRHIVSAAVADLPKQRLIEAMTGETGGLNVPDAVLRPPLVNAAPVLQVDGLAGPDFADIGFTVRRGEIVGLAGATSSGCMTVAETVAGLRRPRAGTVRVDDRLLRLGDVPDALARASAACRVTGIGRASCSAAPSATTRRSPLAMRLVRQVSCCPAGSARSPPV